MRVDRYADRSFSGSCAGEALGPGLDPETEKVFGNRGFLSPFEVRHRLELVDVDPIQDERVAVLLAPVLGRSIFRHRREFYCHRRAFLRR